MKLYKLIVMLLVFWIIAVYCMFAFTTWNLHPIEWGEDGRFFFCMILLFGGFIVCGATITTYTDR